MSEQIARDVEVARIHVEEELQSVIDGLDRSNETIAKYQDNYAKVYKYHSQQRKPWSKKQNRDYYMAVIRSNLGWKVKDFREAERLKRKGLNLDQESVKKLKTSEEVTEEAKSPDEVPEEKVKEMMQLVLLKKFMLKPFKSNIPLLTGRFTLRDRGVIGRLQGHLPVTEMKLWVELKRLFEPDDEDQLWTHTQNFMHAPVEWKLYDMCGVHQVTSKDKEIFMLVEKDYPLRKGLALVMICYKLQMENYLQMVNDLILKIYKIANSPRQQGD
nr:hypothetical protein [Tanacetum cinerariifolium]